MGERCSGLPCADTLCIVVSCECRSICFRRYPIVLHASAAARSDVTPLAVCSSNARFLVLLLLVHRSYSYTRTTSELLVCGTEGSFYSRLNNYIQVEACRSKVGTRMTLSHHLGRQWVNSGKRAYLLFRNTSPSTFWLILHTRYCVVRSSRTL